MLLPKRHFQIWQAGQYLAIPSHSFEFLPSIHFLTSLGVYPEVSRCLWVWGGRGAAECEIIKGIGSSQLQEQVRSAHFRKLKKWVEAEGQARQRAGSSGRWRQIPSNSSQGRLPGGRALELGLEGWGWFGLTGVGEDPALCVSTGSSKGFQRQS